MTLSLVPVLIVVQLGSLVFFTRRAARRNTLSDPQRKGLYSIVALWAVWALLSGYFGADGGYVSESILATLPALWVPLIPIASTLIVLALVPEIRSAARVLVDTTPAQYFIYFQALRISAVGTLYKTSIGEFPAYFEIGVGIPDLLYGLSALLLARRARHNRIGKSGLLAWNLIGFLIIVPTAPLLIQMGLPGPLQVFTTPPTALALYEYPMALAPSVTVPFFVMFNMLVVWRLLETVRQRD